MPPQSQPTLLSSEGTLVVNLAQNLTLSLNAIDRLSTQADELRADLGRRDARISELEEMLAATRAELAAERATPAADLPG